MTPLFFTSVAAVPPTTFPPAGPGRRHLLAGEAP